MFWSDQSGRWNGPVALSATGFAPPGAPLCTGPQFGVTNQTNVWVVDNSGRLVVFLVECVGGWNGPVAVSAPGFAPPGSAVTTSQQFGAVNQTDVFVVDNIGRMNVFYVQGAGSWAGPAPIGPPGETPRAGHWPARGTSARPTRPTCSA